MHHHRNVRSRAPLAPLSVALAAALTLAACAGGPNKDRETWAEELRLDSLAPLSVLPNTTLVVRGQGFVSSMLGTTRLRITGTYTAYQGGSQDVDQAMLVEVISDEELHVVLDSTLYAQLCPEGHGELIGAAQVEVASLASGTIYTTPTAGAGLLCRETLQPILVSIDEGSYTLNAVVNVLADDVLLGGTEGETSLLVSGCYLAQGLPAPCSVNGTTVPEQRVPLLVSDTDGRRDGTIALVPDLVGVNPGTLEATIQLLNTHAGNTETVSSPMDWTVTVLPSRLDSVEGEGASLGGYVDFLGGGFIGSGDGETTEFDLVGTFAPDNGSSRSLDLTLIAEFDSGERARYVLNEQGLLGQQIDLRAESGTVSGTFTPRIVKGTDTYTGSAISGSFRIEPVRQVVFVNFTQGYKDALELFGLRAADSLIRERILEKARWLYRGIGVTFDDAPPEDYVWYAQVDVTGIDPNGLGLMGYDNSHGKDTDNLRLYDRIGGVNALTQEDGYPGYGGIFVESFLAFSTHPPDGLDAIPGASPLFDEIFDPFRPGSGDPASADEVVGLVPITSGDACPAGDRLVRLRCAIFVLGNLLGGTMAHELGHSLGLADPGGDQFHNSGEEAYRLMDSGGSRPFLERAELEPGAGPEVFCRQNYEYLQTILPTAEPDPVSSRPTCY